MLLMYADGSMKPSHHGYLTDSAVSVFVFADLVLVVSVILNTKVVALLIKYSVLKMKLTALSCLCIGSMYFAYLFMAVFL